MTKRLTLFVFSPRDCSDLMDSVDQRFSCSSVPENDSPSVACTKPGSLSFMCNRYWLDFWDQLILRWPSAPAVGPPSILSPSVHLCSSWFSSQPCLCFLLPGVSSHCCHSCLPIPWSPLEPCSHCKQTTLSPQVYSAHHSKNPPFPINTLYPTENYSFSYVVQCPRAAPGDRKGGHSLNSSSLL